ncbi:hypothetical protein ACF06P_38330 [Streptomyces sp. NPDC015684]|uniref:hypothetical protein n=1 Tax=unclassified Streptomyces TaxID=2593676 RepID=UPI0036FF21EB
MKCNGETLVDTWLGSQAQGDQVVALLQKADDEPTSVRTSGLPEIDGAPRVLFTVPSPVGDTGSFGLAALLIGLLGKTVDPDVIGASCFHYRRIRRVARERNRERRLADGPARFT